MSASAMGKDQEQAQADSGFNAAVGWAWVGAIWFALICYSLTMWIVSGQATPTVPVDAEPWRVTVFRVVEISSCVSALMVFYYVVYQPKRKTGRFSSAGLVCLAAFTCWYQDPLLNYIVPCALASSIFTNLGSWSAFFPGAIAPNINRVPEGLFLGCVYIGAMPGIIYSVLWFMQKWKGKFPGTSSWGVLLAGFGFSIIMNLVLELPSVYLQMWGYPGAIRSLTFWAGQTYQYPVYEGVFLSLTFVTWAAVLYFKNEQGQRCFEKGLERVKVGNGSKTGIRYLALVGLFQTIFLTTYFVPTWLFSLHQDAWVENFPKHLTNNVCGPGSGIICPGPGIPIFRGKGGLVISPDGNLVRQPLQ